MYVRSLRIENLRCFERAEVDLQIPETAEQSFPQLPNVNLLLGANGAGKTTLLKAISLGVLAQNLPSSGFVPYHLVRRRAQEAHVVVDLILHSQDVPGSEPIELRSPVWVRTIKGQEEVVRKEEKLSRLPKTEKTLLYWQELYDDESPAFLLVGYGASRWVNDIGPQESVASQRKRRSLRYQRIAGLFEEQVSLWPLVAWLPMVQAKDRARFDEIRVLLNELLPLDCRFPGVMERDEYLFDHCGVRVPQGALSDGYRAYIGWISDLLFNISRGLPEGTCLRDARGVVLVDEIDLHLHPEWQREVVPTVARALPNLQFVFTTHSPIVAGTLNAQNIFVLEMDEKGASSIRQLEEHIHGLNADQILVSSYFGLDTTRAPGAVDELRDLSKKAMAGDSAAAVAFLKKIASGTEEPSPKRPRTSSRRPSSPRSTRTRAK